MANFLVGRRQTRTTSGRKKDESVESRECNASRVNDLEGTRRSQGNGLRAETATERRRRRKREGKIKQCRDPSDFHGFAVSSNPLKVVFFWPRWPFVTTTPGQDERFRSQRERESRTSEKLAYSFRTRFQLPHLARGLSSSSCHRLQLCYRNFV